MSKNKFDLYIAWKSGDTFDYIADVFNLSVDEVKTTLKQMYQERRPDADETFEQCEERMRKEISEIYELYEKRKHVS